ncbi:hypothetical protein FRC17_009741 [Serendipita sp. 399]|nr:hypothetical protein FRC17_009741 [Serendipita sp. 399]
MNSQVGADPVCYWVLLTDNLQFCYTSPSFNGVVPQANALVGRSFLEYLQDPPHEYVAGRLRERLIDDEEKVTIITITYATPTLIRHHLQYNQWVSDHPPEYAYAQYSMIASRAGSFLLVFLHAKAELSSDCNFHLCETLKPGDLSRVAQFLPTLNPHPPYHVFQILSDEERHPIIFTTPTTLARLTIVPQHLAEGTLSPRDLAHNYGNTACTKRTKGNFNISTIEGQLLHVSCTILRHGQSLLVMYRLTPHVPQQSPISPSMPIRYNPPPIPPGQPYQPNTESEYRRTSIPSEGYSQPSPIMQHGVPSHVSPHAYHNSPYSPGPSLARGPPYEQGYPQSPEAMRPSLVSSPRSPTSAQFRGGYAIPIRRHSLTGHTSMPVGYGNLSPRLESLEEHRVGTGQPLSQTVSPTDSTFIMEAGHGSSSSYSETAEVAANMLRGRPAKEPPKGVTCCRTCQTTVTPEWRKGPTGVKDMCNACGLRWNRRVKKIKGDGANPGESLLESLNLSIPEADALLGPQRSGGGSKRGHRKKTTESRGPALTTRPKRRHSDVGSPLSSTTEFSAPPHYMAQQQYQHPHNPHYAQGAMSNHSRPPLEPLFDDGPANLPPHTPLMSTSAPSASNFPPPPFPPPHNVNHVKSPSTPESSQPIYHQHQQSVSGHHIGHHIQQDQKPFHPHYDGQINPGLASQSNQGYTNSPAEHHPIQMPGVQYHHHHQQPQSHMREQTESKPQSDNGSGGHN